MSIIRVYSKCGRVLSLHKIFIFIDYDSFMNYKKRFYILVFNGDTNIE